MKKRRFTGLIAVFHMLEKSYLNLSDLEQELDGAEELQKKVNDLKADMTQALNLLKYVILH